MMFAVVEQAPGLLEPILLGATRGERLTGWRLTGEAGSVALDKVVHVGLAGEHSSVVAQFCPAWLNASMHAAGYGRAARAANPPLGAGRSRSEGVTYQSGELKWSCLARRRRAKEQAIFQQASEGGPGAFAALVPSYDFGYYQIQTFLEQHRRALVPETFFWCTVFASLTAGENTQKAETNLRGFQPLLRQRLQEHGGKVFRGIIGKREFQKAWSSGFQNLKYAAFSSLCDDHERTARVIGDAVRSGLRDAALREAVARTEGGLPGGLGVTKFSFAMELWGGDVACLDRWMLRGLGANTEVDGRLTAPLGKTALGPEGTAALSNKQIVATNRWNARRGKTACAEGPLVPPPPWAPFTDGAYVLSEYGAERFGGRDARGRTPEPVLAEYAWYEGVLARGVYHQLAVKEGAPNPLARAQWTMWEDILRRHPRKNVRIDRATHAPVFVALYGKEAVAREAEAALAKHWATRGAGPEVAENPKERLPDGTRVVVLGRRKGLVRGKLEEAGGRDYSTPWEQYRIRLDDGSVIFAHRNMVEPESKNPYPELRERLGNPDVFGAPASAHLVPVWPGARRAGRQLTGETAVAEFVKGLALTPVERFFAILLDQKNRVLGTVLISQGGLASAIVEPREVFAPAVAARAAALILVHNHPSGDPTPSEADREVTLRLQAAGRVQGIPVLDHVVVAGGRSRSMLQEGLLSRRNPAPADKPARALALRWINEQRAKDGLGPMTRISPLWWKLHGAEWIQRARPAGENPARKSLLRRSAEGYYSAPSRHGEVVIWPTRDGRFEVRVGGELLSSAPTLAEAERLAGLSP